jgi:hypothetical protein
MNLLFTLRSQVPTLLLWFGGGMFGCKSVNRVLTASFSLSKGTSSLGDAGRFAPWKQPWSWKNEREMRKSRDMGLTWTRNFFSSSYYQQQKKEESQQLSTPNPLGNQNISKFNLLRDYKVFISKRSTICKTGKNFR